MPPRNSAVARSALLSSLACLFAILSAPVINAQDTVTGAFEGIVSDSQTGAGLKGATVEIINQQTGLTFSLRTDFRGSFFQGLLLPGIYIVRVAMPGYQTKEVLQRLRITYTGEVVPIPVALDPVPAGAAASASPTPAPVVSVEDTDIRATIGTVDGRRSGSFIDEEVVTLPLGGTTMTRTFDELALLLPGVAPPPQTLGSVAGPGVGVGAGSAGQFAVNGLRSRGNNFTVDGSDNNDEDIGVRRQGFLALVPQPIESIEEYQVITLLAPAQFGRNLGAQVNAVSKSGGSKTHGTLYGFFNSSRLNARNFFDTTNGNAIAPLRVGNQSVLLASFTEGIPFNGSAPGSTRQPLTVQNMSGGEDSSTLGQVGLVLGGPLYFLNFGEGGPLIRKSSSLFYFISAERQILNATKEENFAVPTVEQRGVFGSGATGLFRNPLSGRPLSNTPTKGADEIFSFYPFPNNPTGIYGNNTFTQVLPASGRGIVLSGKIDGNFKLRERQQSLTGRYNFTDDWRIIPATGGAIFSAIKPRVRTQNVSFFLNSEISGVNSTNQIFNQVRLSYGRTRLRFEEARDTTFLLPSGQTRFSRFFPRPVTFGPNDPFLLNARVLRNFTLPALLGIPNVGPVIYGSRTIPTLIVSPGFPGFPGIPPQPPSVIRQSLFPFETTEETIGPVGQVFIPGFSPIGVDVNNFPQRRVNNTYQVADTMTLRSGSHSYSFGADMRRTELNSELAPNSRSLVSFSGAPELLRVGASLRFSGRFFNPIDLAANGIATRVSQTFTTGPSSNINLRYYQLNFFAQDEWRIRSDLSLSYGLRYEYNTPPREVTRKIESTFDDARLGLLPGVRQFLEGRESIFDLGKYNFAPRVGVAFSPNLFGRGRVTVIRAGYGLFYDQILGAVVSQSRNVYPTFLTLSLPAGTNFVTSIGTSSPRGLLDIFNFVDPSTLNTLNRGVSLPQIINTIRDATLGYINPAPEDFFQATIPARRLRTPVAHHYSLTFEQQLGSNLVASIGYVGTTGRHLLRFTTPNLGTNAIYAVTAFGVDGSRSDPRFEGFLFQPGSTLTQNLGITGGRPISGVGIVNRFETTAASRYDAVQMQVRGRFRSDLQFQTSYTFSKATDDVSDVFDLAGASALPQNNLTLEGENGPANFDARHRLSSYLLYEVSSFGRQNQIIKRLVSGLLSGLQIATTGRFQTGQPFTVNSIFDVNLDGNLTDRLNTSNGIVQTGDRQQPLQLTTNNPSSLLAPVGQDGSVPRNTFRAGSVLELDLSVIKNFAITERQKFTLRVDVFNVINRANFGVPIRFLEAPGFGRATETVTPGRRIQFALKYSF